MIAITRGVSPSIERCELTHNPRVPIDYERARRQHGAYQDALRQLGLEVRELPPDDAMPDCVFVEDTAVVLDAVAVAARPGAASRREEAEVVLEALRPFRPIVPIAPPATLDGGDVLVLDRKILVGFSSRTCLTAVEQMRAIAEPLGYEVAAVLVSGVLHLKSAVTPVAPNTLLINDRFVDRTRFAGCEFIEVDPSEPQAANALRVGDRVIYPMQYPKTLQRLESRGIEVVPVDVSELVKAEGGVTCCSLLVEQ